MRDRRTYKFRVGESAVGLKCNYSRSIINGNMIVRGTIAWSTELKPLGYCTFSNGELIEVSGRDISSFRGLYISFFDTQYITEVVFVNGVLKSLEAYMPGEIDRMNLKLIAVRARDMEQKMKEILIGLNYRID